MFFKTRHVILHFIVSKIVFLTIKSFVTENLEIWKAQKEEGSYL